VYGPVLRPNAGEGRSLSRIEPSPAMMVARSRTFRSFPHITGPIVPMKDISTSASTPVTARAVFPVQILQHDFSDRRDIFFMFTQRRQYDLEYAQAIIKLFAQMRSGS